MAAGYSINNEYVAKQMLTATKLLLLAKNAPPWLKMLLAKRSSSIDGCARWLRIDNRGKIIRIDELRIDEIAQMAPHQMSHR
jgi:hypothetical protein